MTQLNFTQEAPLFQDDEGRIRVKGSRVTLDTLVARFQVGDTIEEINQGFPTISIAQIYAVIAWYLNNRAEAEEYLDRQKARDDETLRVIGQQFNHAAFVERLLKRREELSKG